jgi:hypothetical protein
MFGKNENKYLIIGDRTSEKVDEILSDRIPKRYQKMYVLNLNNYSTTRLGTLKSKMNDFLKNQSIFMNYPKVLVAKDLNYSNENIKLIYSKMLSLLPNNMLMIASCSSTNQIPKNIILDSTIIYVENEMKKIDREEFWEWLNVDSKELHNVQIKDYLNREFMSKYMRKEEYTYMNSILDSKSSNMRDEIKKLILKMV